MSFVRATPFHARAADLNRRNAWIARNGFTLAADYGDAMGEALAARVSVVMADISWRWRVRLDGARAGEALSRLLTRDPGTLGVGAALKALWLNDAGAVRGAGLLARLAETRFLLASTAPDRDWILAAAKLFGLSVEDVSETQAGLALIGPYARPLVAAAGLDPDLDVLASRTGDWRGLEVTLSRWGEHGGYELWCNADDALLVWDRIARAGARFGAMPAGTAAMDILDLEGGIPRPDRDYRPARDGRAAEPQPGALGLERLIDPAHAEFNGRAAWLAAQAGVRRTLAGIAIDGETPAPHAPLMHNGMIVGRTFGSLASPGLRRAIALAQLDLGAAAPGTSLTVALPASADAPIARNVAAHVATLPFLPIPDPLPA